MGDFTDKLSAKLLPKAQSNGEVQDISVKLPAVNLRLDGDLTRGRVDHGDYWLDPNITYHSLRSDSVTGLYAPLFQVPTMLFQKYLPLDPGDAVTLWPQLAFNFTATAGLFYFYRTAEHEYGHLTAYKEAGIESWIDYNFFQGERAAATTNPIFAKDTRISKDSRLLVLGAGLATATSGFRSTLESRILTGNQLDVSSAQLLSMHHLGALGAADSDGPKAYNVMTGKTSKASSYAGVVNVVNATRPYGTAALIGALTGETYSLPDIVPNWYADIGPLGILYTFTTALRLRERSVIQPEIRFSTVRPSATVGFSYFLTGVEGMFRTRLSGEMWYQPILEDTYRAHPDGEPTPDTYGLGAAFGVIMIAPVINGVEIYFDARYKTDGYIPDAATLRQNFSGSLSLKISDRIF